jgi:hypothetical protein
MPKFIYKATLDDKPIGNYSSVNILMGSIYHLMDETQKQNMRKGFANQSFEKLYPKKLFR